MVRATTPTLTLTINDESVDLTAARNVYVTLEQNDTTLTKTGEELELVAQPTEARTPHGQTTNRTTT